MELRHVTVLPPHVCKPLTQISPGLHEQAVVASPPTLLCPPLGHNLRFTPLWEMTAWLDGIAIIATSHRVDAPGGTCISAEEVFVDSSKAVSVVIAQPREHDLLVSADRGNPYRIDPITRSLTADDLLCNFNVQGGPVANVPKQPPPGTVIDEDEDRHSRTPLGSS